MAFRSPDHRLLRITTGPSLLDPNQPYPPPVPVSGISSLIQAAIDQVSGISRGGGHMLCEDAMCTPNSARVKDSMGGRSQLFSIIAVTDATAIVQAVTTAPDQQTHLHTRDVSPDGPHTGTNP